MAQRILQTMSLLPTLYSIPAHNVITATPFTTVDAATSSATLVTTTALPGSDTPSNHWTPDRPDPYICEYLGENDCWRPSIVEEGPPYMGFGNSRPPRRRTCIVPSGNQWPPSHSRWQQPWQADQLPLNDDAPLSDDAPAIMQAFRDCKENARIIFQNTTYNIRQVMNTTGLRNVDVEVRGTLAWDNSDIDYWLTHSLPIGFQNQSSAWVFGGENVHFYGNGYGTLNGNGQVWYTYANGVGNLHGRPHALTISNCRDCVIEGLNFIKPQMWTMTIARSERVLLQDIYVNASCESGAGTFNDCNLNTDGANTLYANNVTFLRWTIDNGDDAIALKQNSTNIYIADSKFYSGQGIALGSIGQYPGQIEVIANFTARNIECYGTTYGAYLKTWTGLSKGYLPNGGGGGFGYGQNLTFDGFMLNDVSSVPWEIEQKESYNGETGGEYTSMFQWRNITFNNAHGTTRGNKASEFQCSGAAPCNDITIINNAFTSSNDGSEVMAHLCDNVQNPRGFVCTHGSNAANFSFS